MKNTHKKGKRMEEVVRKWKVKIGGKKEGLEEEEWSF
jgi:hypothetical protein